MCCCACVRGPVSVHMLMCAHGSYACVCVRMHVQVGVCMSGCGMCVRLSLVAPEPPSCQKDSASLTLTCTSSTCFCMCKCLACVATISLRSSGTEAHLCAWVCARVLVCASLFWFQHTFECGQYGLSTFIFDFKETHGCGDMSGLHAWL